VVVCDTDRDGEGSADAGGELAGGGNVEAAALPALGAGLAVPAHPPNATRTQIARAARVRGLIIWLASLGHRCESTRSPNARPNTPHAAPADCWESVAGTLSPR